jgi:hypothetical protein
MAHFTVKQYTDLNNTLGAPFVFALTERGFFSEVRNLLSAVIFGLRERRRLMVDQSGFGGLHWSDFFGTDLPESDPSLAVDPEWRIAGNRHDGFKLIRSTIDRMWRRGETIDVPKCGCLDIFCLQREIADVFCAPKIRHRPLWDRMMRPATFRREALVSCRRLGLSPGTFAAFHIRRGDKIEGGNPDRTGRSEGEDTSVSTYLDLMYQNDPVDSLFVLSDDHRPIESLREMRPKLNIVSLCPASSNGFRQYEFNNLTPGQKRPKIAQLITEAQIASQSAYFLGPFKSNVSRFIANMHSHPEKCFSVDAMAEWSPR